MRHAILLARDGQTSSLPLTFHAGAIVTLDAVEPGFAGDPAGEVLTIPYMPVQFHSRYPMPRQSSKGVEEARSELPRILDEAEHGRPTVITRHGKPVAA